MSRIPRSRRDLVRLDCRQPHFPYVLLTFPLLPYLLPTNPILDQTWIIIVLIIISIIVTISEVFLRFALLNASQGPAGTPAGILARVMGRSVTPSPSPEWYPYSAGNAPPGCICPSLGPAGTGSDMGVSGMMGY